MEHPDRNIPQAPLSFNSNTLAQSFQIPLFCIIVTEYTFVWAAGNFLHFLMFLFVVVLVQDKSIPFGCEFLMLDLE